MARLESFGTAGEGGRAVRFLALDDLEDWPTELRVGSPHFVLFLCCDARKVADAALRAAARRAISQGMVYLCAWGPECDRVETAFVEAAGIHETAESAILTEADGEEPLAQALRIALRDVVPATDFESTCRTTLIVCAGLRRRAEEIRAMLEDPTDLDDDAHEIDDDDE